MGTKLSALTGDHRCSLSPAGEPAASASADDAAERHAQPVLEAGAGARGLERPAAGAMAHPDFIIIGAQKSASTFLHYCLSQHPDVYVAPGEVPIFEDPDFAAYHVGYFPELFRGRSERCLGIRRPNYLGRPEVPARIVEVLPRVKLIAVLRNPVDRAVSSAFHLMAGSFIPVMDIETCMRRLLQGELQRRYPRAWQILEFGKYHQCLSAYEEFLARNRMFLVTQDRFLQDKEHVLAEAFRFLGVDDRFVPADLASTKQPGHYHPLTQRMVRLANTISHYRDDANVRAHPRGRLARLAGRSLKEAANLIQAKVLKGAQPRLSEQCRAELAAFYREDIEMLERLTGWDCSAWKGGGAAPG